VAIGEARVPRLAGIGSTSGSKGASDLSFGSLLKKRLDRPAALENGVLAQLAGLLHAGTPLATIVDSVAKTVSTALHGAVGGDGSANGQRTLERALAGALAPPGASPPNESGLQQAASLEHRLANVIAKVMGELKNAGQQSRFSGQVLDANSARETPAQQKDPTFTGAPADAVHAFAQALLQKAVSGSPAPAPQADILTRILTRAANADAQRSGQPAQAAPAGAHTPSASALFDRLIAIVAEHAQAQPDAKTGKQPTSEFTLEQNAPPQAPSVHQAQTTLAAAPAFSSQVSSATGAAPAPTPAVSSTVDPHAVIEQIIKGIAMRTVGSTSELRLRLQPEHLGDVALKLTVNGNTVSANIVAQNAHVRDVLLANQQQLARSLSDAGLSLGNFSVDVSGGNSGFTQQHTRQQHAAGSSRSFGVALSGEDDQWNDTRFGPPLVAAGKALVLNYLA
jgi:flagellar hook-length control protein FliK